MTNLPATLTRSELLDLRDAARRRMVALDYPGHPAPWDAAADDSEFAALIMARVDQMDIATEQAARKRAGLPPIRIASSAPERAVPDTSVMNWRAAHEAKALRRPA